MIINDQGLVEINHFEEVSNIKDYIKLKYCLFTKDFFFENLKEIRNNKKNGLKIGCDQGINELGKYLDTFNLIDINFLSFRDGRPFSIARDLREIYHFKKEIRASGYILPDQFIFLIKCGFNSVEIDPQKKETWFSILKESKGLDYQK